MESARPLREVLGELVGDESARRALVADSEQVLREAGHAGLPEGLVAEAVVSYADTAVIEVAEHLAPFVMARSAVPLEEADAGPDPRQALELLTTVPAASLGDEPQPEPAPGDAEPSLVGDERGTGDTPYDDFHGVSHGGDAVPGPFGLDFGAGEWTNGAESFVLPEPGLGLEPGPEPGPGLEPEPDEFGYAAPPAPPVDGTGNGVDSYPWPEQPEPDGTDRPDAG